MFKFVFVSVAVLVIAQTNAKVAKQAAEVQEEGGLQKIVKNVQAGLNEATNVLKGNLPDSKDVVNKISESAQQLANNAQETANKLKTEIKSHEGDINKIFKQISESLSETNASIQKAIGPEGQKKAEEIKSKFEEGLKKFSEETERLSKALEPEAKKLQEEIKSVTQNFFEQVSKVAKDIADLNKTKQ